VECIPKDTSTSLPDRCKSWTSFLVVSGCDFVLPWTDSHSDIWNSLFIFLLHLTLVKLSLSSASTALHRCLFIILQISCASSCFFNLSFALYPPIHPPVFLLFLLPLTFALLTKPHLIVAVYHESILTTNTPLRFYFRSDLP
jgi:hypothetical protein